MPFIDSNIVELTRRDIAGSGIGTDPKTIAAFESLQRAAYEIGPGNTEEARAAAELAAQEAAAAQSSADGAQTTAEFAQLTADDAQERADEAFDLAGERVAKRVGPVFAAPAGSVSRVALPAYVASTAGGTYTVAQVQALMNQVEALSKALAAVVTDLRANEALTPS